MLDHDSDGKVMVHDILKWGRANVNDKGQKEALEKHSRTHVHRYGGGGLDLKTFMASDFAKVLL